MGKKTDLIRAARAIRRSLLDFVKEGESDSIRVFESSPGHLRVIVGSERFRKKGIAERQEMIWAHLREHVDARELAYCLGVHTMDMEEYEEEFFPQSSSSAAGAFAHGEELAGGEIDE